MDRIRENKKIAMYMFPSVTIVTCTVPQTIQTFCMTSNHVLGNTRKLVCRFAGADPEILKRGRGVRPCKTFFFSQQLEKQISMGRGGG